METEMTLRPMTETERMYSYTQSQQLIMQTGCIGHLSGDFGSNGKQFFSSWDDHRADLKSDDFKHEFDEVINALREDDQYSGILKSRDSLSSVCRKFPESNFGNDREYGFRADTDHYSYLFRLNPHKGEYNIYCYCYFFNAKITAPPSVEEQISFMSPDYILPEIDDNAQLTFLSAPVLPQQVIDEALCIGYNDQNSRLIICAYFMKDKPLEDNVIIRLLRS